MNRKQTNRNTYAFLVMFFLIIAILASGVGVLQFKKHQASYAEALAIKEQAIAQQKQVEPDILIARGQRNINNAAAITIAINSLLVVVLVVLMFVALITIIVIFFIYTLKGNEHAKV